MGPMVLSSRFFDMGSDGPQVGIGVPSELLFLLVGPRDLQLVGTYGPVAGCVSLNCDVSLSLRK